jgi:hypothetical protein
MVDPCTLTDIYSRMDCHQGQAGWAQAIGSILAILFSSALAIAVPIHMRMLEERAKVQRAILACTYVIDHLLAAWGSFEKMVRAKSFEEHSLQLVLGHLELLDRIVSAIEVARLGPNALNILSRAHNSAIVLETVARRAAEQALEDAALEAFVIAQNDARGWMKELGQIVPVRLQGVWIGDRPNFWKK